MLSEVKNRKEAQDLRPRGRAGDRVAVAGSSEYRARLFRARRSIRNELEDDEGERDDRLWNYGTVAPAELDPFGNNAG